MKGLLKSSIHDNNPVIILEYKSNLTKKVGSSSQIYTIPTGVEIKTQETV